MHFSLVKRGWRGCSLLAALQEYIPFFFLSISSIRQSPMILLLFAFPLLFFWKNLEKKNKIE